MRRHAKASSAGSTFGGGNGPGSVRRGAFATRGGFGDADGSGAPSLRARVAALALGIAALGLLALAPLSQAKVVVNGFGTAIPSSGIGNSPTPAFGAQFGQVQGVAVNNSGAGGVAKGTIYVVDGQNRVQRFSPFGDFERTWGQNVIGRDERQLIAVDSGQQGSLSGSFTLTFGGETTTLEVVGGALSAATVKGSLEALPSIGAGNVAVGGSLSTTGGAGGTGGGKFMVRFVGALAGTNLPPLNVDISQLVGTPPLSASVSTVEDGSGGNSTGFEICTVASQCKDGDITAATGNGGQLNNPQGIAVNPANGHVYVTEGSNRRISEFDADGSFVRTWGWDVVGANEVQTVTVNATGGKFKLAFGANSTAELNATSTAAQVQTALQGLASIGAGNATVTLLTAGSIRTYTVTFASALAGTDVPQLVATSGPVSPLTGGAATIGVLTTTTGFGGPFGGFEICTVAAECKTGAEASTGPSSGGPGGGAGQLGNNHGTPVFDASGNLLVPELSNSRIQVFGPSGAFVKMVGGDVVDDGATGTATLSTTSNTITAVTTTTKAFRVGQTLTAAGGQIPPGTIIAAIGSGTITLSQKPTAAGSGIAITAPPGAENVPFNEKQTITVSGASSGTFTLRFSTPEPSATGATTTAIPYSASAAEVESKLAALSNLGAANVAVTGPNGGPWTVEFKGTRFADTDIQNLTAPGAGANIAITSANASEVCTIAADCRAGAPGTSAGQFGTGPEVVGGQSPTGLAFDSGGNLYVADRFNNRVQKLNPALTSASTFGAATFAAFTKGAPSQVIATQGGNRLLFALTNNVNAIPNEVQLLEVDPADASVKEVSLVGSKLTESSGLAANANNGDVYLTTNSAASPRKVLTLASTPLADPVPAMDPVTTKTDTTATLSGTVNPKGGWVSCTFQYSTDQLTWTDVPEPDCDSVSAGGGPQALSQSVTGLTPGSHYFVRLSVSRPLVAGSAKTTLSKAFDTNGAGPVLSAIGATQIQDTSVRLIATIDPRNSPTGYVFQYGTTPSLGSSTDPVDIGGGSTPLIVSQLIEGLKPDTTYYFKVTATNLVGSTTSPGQSFKTRTDPQPLPGGRAYEQVSPADKNFGGVDFSPTPVFAAAYDGEAAGFCTASGLSTDPPGQVSNACSNYVSRRGPERWGTKALNPPICAGSVATSVPSLNLDHALVGVLLSANGCPIPPLAPGAPSSGSGYALYRENLLSDPVGFDPIASLATELRLAAGNTPAMSDDASHMVYPSEAKQTSDAPAGNAVKVFDWSGGNLVLASRDTANQPFTTSSQVPENAVNGVSASGDRIFFQNPVTQGFGATQCLNATCEIYMRENATATHWVSQQECTVACSNTAAADRFEWATPDGSRVFFRSEAKLTDADTQAGTDLYLYTHSASPAADKNLSFLSKDNEPADGNVADVLGVLGASDDGETVYFVANGQIVLGQPTAGGPKVYRWRWNGGSPTIDYLATLRPGFDNEGDVRNWDGVSGRPLIRLVTTDGRYLLVQTAAVLNPVVDRDSTRDVYRWGGGQGWVCVSCQAPGAPSAGISRIDGTDLTGRVLVPGQGPVATIDQGLMNDQLRIVMSDDGARVFFTTADALVPGDVNGIAEDVYEWHDGSIGMISSGLDQEHAFLIGSSASGRDVFFITYESLVGWDTDANTDVYDARLGGGYPEPPPTGALCEGEACRSSSSSSAPPATGAGTASFQGPGNPPPKETCPKGKVRRRGQCVRKPARKRGKHAAKSASKKRSKHPNGRAGR